MLRSMEHEPTFHYMPCSMLRGMEHEPTFHYMQEWHLGGGVEGVGGSELTTSTMPTHTHSSVSTRTLPLHPPTPTPPDLTWYAVRPPPHTLALATRPLQTPLTPSSP